MNDLDIFSWKSLEFFTTLSYIDRFLWNYGKYFLQDAQRLKFGGFKRCFNAKYFPFIPAHSKILVINAQNMSPWKTCFHFQHKIPPAACPNQVASQKRSFIPPLLWWPDCLPPEHISACCVYSANYSWCLCTLGRVDSPQINLLLWFVVKVQSAFGSGLHSSPNPPCSHVYVTSDEQSRCSLLETLHGSLAL